MSSGRRRKHPVLRALCALLLLLGAAAAAADEAKPLTAILLVARSELPDSDFADSVVLVMNNLGPGPVGVILNRPTPMPVSQLFPDTKRFAQLNEKVYFGGPVELDTVWFLVRAATPPEHAIKAVDGLYLSASRELLLKLLARDKPMEGLRIFLGHSGWAPGQLEAEISRGDWKLERADSSSIFGKPEHLWPGPDEGSEAQPMTTRLLPISVGACAAQPQIDPGWCALSQTGPSHRSAELYMRQSTSFRSGNAPALLGIRADSLKPNAW